MNRTSLNIYIKENTWKKTWHSDLIKNHAESEFLDLDFTSYA